jgi:hypothetical protein
MASLGHSSTQDSQPVHFALFTFAGIYITLSKNNILQTLPQSTLRPQRKNRYTLRGLPGFAFGYAEASGLCGESAPRTDEMLQNQKDNTTQIFVCSPENKIAIILSPASTYIKLVGA